MKSLDASPPFTSNQHAASLIRRATDKCAGCRTAWRLDGWIHRSSKRPRVECIAKGERQELRDIASAARNAQSEGASRKRGE